MFFYMFINFSIFIIYTHWTRSRDQLYQHVQSHPPTVAITTVYFQIVQNIN